MNSYRRRRSGKKSSKAASGKCSCCAACGHFDLAWGGRAKDCISHLSVHSAFAAYRIKWIYRCYWKRVLRASALIFVVDQLFTP
jgi:hypothetical protein